MYVGSLSTHDVRMYVRNNASYVCMYAHGQRFHLYNPLL